MFSSERGPTVKKEQIKQSVNTCPVCAAGCPTCTALSAVLPKQQQVFFLLRCPCVSSLILLVLL